MSIFTLFIEYIKIIVTGTVIKKSMHLKKKRHQTKTIMYTITTVHRQPQNYKYVTTF